ncbi:hypothetical protein K440DRAFT_662846 [Wilcoxina mikolae CBS 423.85]|nr:hypothetical protein K440DRAFT_662846 [Wilcoxina mikolae CBS 423.85]
MASPSCAISNPQLDTTDYEAGKCTITSIHWYQRLGSNGFRVLSLGTIVILAGFSFLFFLWRRDSTSLTWKYIVVTGWASQSATLTIELISLVLAAQVGIATSMLASIALESFQVTLPEAAAISIIRYTNMGPNDLASALKAGMRRKDFMTATAMVFPLVVTTFLSQFMSTILLRDMAVGDVAGESQVKALRTMKPIGGNGTIDFSNRKDYYWMLKPPRYPAFAEYSTNHTLEDGVSDTGSTLRAFLPLATSAERTRLHSYSGDATVFDSRVVCMPPNFTSVMAEGNGNEQGYDGFDIIRLVGRFGLIKKLPEGVWIRHKWPPEGYPFNCSASLPLATEEQQDITPQIPLTLCLWHAGQNGGLTSELQSSSGGWTYIVINTTGSRAGWYSLLKSQNVTNWYFTERDEWMECHPTNNTEYKLSVSLCTADFSTATFPIHAISSSPRTEPEIDWDFSRNSFSTISIRQQLIKNSTDTTDSRGLLTLDVQAKHSWKEMKKVIQNFTQETYGAGHDWAATTNVTAMMCTHCYDSPVHSSGTKWVNPSHVSLFQDILRTTGRPALAIQAHFTTMVQMVYYDRLPTNQNFSLVVMDEFVQVTLPNSFRGFTTVFVLVVVHLLLLLGVTRKFLSNVKFSVVMAAVLMWGYVDT